MGFSCYMLFYDGTEMEKEKIIKCIKDHNYYFSTLTDEQKEDPDFDKTGEDLSDVISIKLLKSRPKQLSKFTHVILCNNGGGRINTINWFSEHKITWLMYNTPYSRWLSKKSERVDKIEYEFPDSIFSEKNISNLNLN